MKTLLWAAGGTGFTFAMTTLGSAVVFFFKNQMRMGIQKIFLGFAAGVMIAASVWSLLIPAIEEAVSMDMVGWMPAAGGFILGIAFLMILAAPVCIIAPISLPAQGQQRCVRPGAPLPLYGGQGKDRRPGDGGDACP